MISLLAFIHRHPRSAGMLMLIAFVRWLLLLPLIVAIVIACGLPWDMQALYFVYTQNISIIFYQVCHILFNYPSLYHLSMACIIMLVILTRTLLAMESRRQVLMHLGYPTVTSFMNMITTTGVQLYSALLIFVLAVAGIGSALLQVCQHNALTSGHMTYYTYDLILGMGYILFHVLTAYTFELIIEGHHRIHEWLYQGLRLMRHTLMYWAELIIQLIGLYAFIFGLSACLLPAPLASLCIAVWSRIYMILTYCALPFFAARGYVWGMQCMTISSGSAPVSDIRPAQATVIQDSPTRSETPLYADPFDLENEYEL